jgi:NAD(P)-dependent dehydrogenase (short-subunit alcohol dehydrogenase family)
MIDGTMGMNGSKQVLVIGGTSGIGRATARWYAAAGHRVVLTGRDAERAKEVAVDIGGDARGVAVDLNRPEDVADQLRDAGHVDHLVLAAVERDHNTVWDYDIDRAVRLTTLKLVGYTAVVGAVASRMDTDASAVLVGGLAMRRPYPGSTTVTTVNGGVAGLVRTLAFELAPRRFNAIHPALVADTPYWDDKPQAVEGALRRTPTGRLATTDDVVDAIVFLLRNRAMNCANLEIDCGATLG